MQIPVNITKTILIPSDELKEMQEFLESAGEDKVDTIKTYTANFGDRGEGEIEVDIKVCQGDPPFVDAVLFQDGHEVGCLEPEGDLVGEYIFSSFLKDTYTVIVSEKRSDADICPKCGKQNVKAHYTEKGTVAINDGDMDPDSMTGDEIEVYGPYKCYECGHEWDDE